MLAAASQRSAAHAARAQARSGRPYGPSTAPGAHPKAKPAPPRPAPPPRQRQRTHTRLPTTPPPPPKRPTQATKTEQGQHQHPRSQQQKRHDQPERIVIGTLDDAFLSPSVVLECNATSASFPKGVAEFPRHANTPGFGLNGNETVYILANQSHAATICEELQQFPAGVPIVCITRGRIQDLVNEGHECRPHGFQVQPMEIELPLPNPQRQAVTTKRLAL